MMYSISYVGSLHKIIVSALSCQNLLDNVDFIKGGI